MFILKKDNFVKHKVEIFVPSENDSGFSKASLVVKFRILDDDETESLEDGSDKLLLEKVVMEVEGVADEDGNALPSTPETIASVIKNPFASAAIIREYVFLTKGKNLKRKN